MKTRYVIAWLLLPFASTSASAALQPVCKVLAQADAPLEISAYTCAYHETSTRMGPIHLPEGIRHSLEYRNVRSDYVEAVEIGLVSFDVWNEFLDRTRGISVEFIAPRLSRKGSWVARAYSDFAFLTGVAYVSRVRFRDGSIWEANLEEIGSGMREIEANFDMQRLTEKEKPGAE